ncbi:probable cytochrome P450 313a1 [Colias croceus]|uniref:probable cytochrome P450 313a1 n=1 Tax=Colias crocea TaxID=72248 RepID=UPI001E27B139|nr:probable cytochrome P450 313a1 [Colias croceus]
MYIWLLLLAVLFSYYVFRLRRKRLYELANKFPIDDNSLPIIGAAYSLLGSTEHILEVMQNSSYASMNNGGVLASWFGPLLYFVVTEAPVLETVLKSSLEKDDIYRFMWQVIGNGSVFAPVPIWKQRRKMVMPLFSPKILSTFFNIFLENSEKLCSVLSSFINRGQFSL